MLKFNVVPRKNPINKIVKYYAQLEPMNPIKLISLAEAISRQCTVTVHDVKAVLSAMEEHICNNLRNGNSVRMGDLGSFRLTVRSTGTIDAKDFTSRQIKNTHVIFYPSTNLRYQLSIQHPQMQFSRINEENDAPVEEENPEESL